MKNTTYLLSILLALSAPLAFAAEGDAANTKPAEAAAPAAKAHILMRAELDSWLAKPEKIVLIDVRRPDELTAIGGFPVYLSIQAKDLEKSLAYIPKDRTVITVSNHAGRAAKAADLLADKGFKVAGAVGSETYEKEGGTIIKIVPPAPKAADATGASVTTAAVQK